MKITTPLRLAALAGLLSCLPLTSRAMTIDKKTLDAEITAQVKKEIAAQRQLQPHSGAEGEAPRALPVEGATRAPLSIADKIRVSGQVRVRPEFRNNLSQALVNVPGASPTDFSVLLRSRVGVQFTPTKHVGFFVQAQDAREFGESVAAVPTAAGDNKGLDLHQGYVDLTEIGNHPLSIRAGRQEIKLGEERLVGAADWTNVARAFDGVLMSYEPQNYSLKAFAAITDKTVASGADGQYFGGVYATWKKFPGGVLDGYYLVLQDNNGATGAAAGTGDTLSVHTIGSRIASKFSNGLDLGVEAAVQLGKFGSNSVLATAGHGAVGYTFTGNDWKPRLGVEYNYATGDDATTSRYTKFNNLFPTNHNKYGMMDLTTWSNMHDASLSIGVKPGRTALSAAYHLLAVDKNQAAGDKFAGTYAGAAGLGKIAGHEMDVQGKWTMNENCEVAAGYGHFMPGSFLKGQGVNQQADFFYTTLQAQF